MNLSLPSCPVSPACFVTPPFSCRCAAVDRKWFPMGRSKRTDPTWQFTPARDPPPSLPTPESRKRRRLSSSSSTGSLHAQQALTAPAAAPLVTCPSPSSSAGSGVGLDLEEKVDGLPLRNALVMVTFDVPYMVNGICSSEYVGAGVVFDKENGERGRQAGRGGSMACDTRR